MFNSNIPAKIDCQNKVLTAINEWLQKVDFPGKVVYKGWLEEKEAVIRYENQPYAIKCDLALFLNIDNVVYHIFIIFKINNFKYELNARKKALLAQKKNGLVSYDDDAKKAFADAVEASAEVLAKKAINILNYGHPIKPFQN